LWLFDPTRLMALVASCARIGTFIAPQELTAGASGGLRFTSRQTQVEDLIVSLVAAEGRTTRSLAGKALHSPAP
jgi:hypothetical protein